MLTATCARIAPHPLWYSGNCSWGRWRLVLARVVSAVALGSGEAWPCGQRLWAVGRPWPWSCAQIWYLPYETIIRDWEPPDDQQRSSQNGGEGGSRKSISGTTRDAWLNETSFPLQILRLNPHKKNGIESSSEDPNACSGCRRPQSWHWAPLL